MGIKSRVLYEMIMEKELGSFVGYSAVNRGRQLAIKLK